MVVRLREIQYIFVELLVVSVGLVPCAPCDRYFVEANGAPRPGKAPRFGGGGAAALLNSDTVGIETVGEEDYC